MALVYRTNLFICLQLRWEVLTHAFVGGSVQSTACFTVVCGLLGGVEETSRLGWSFVAKAGEMDVHPKLITAAAFERGLASTLMFISIPPPRRRLKSEHPRTPSTDHPPRQKHYRV